MSNHSKLFYDIEVSQAVVSGYGTRWDFKPIRMIREQEMMCYSYAWDDDEPTFVSMHDFTTTRQFITSLRDLMDEAQIAIAYNGDKFDNRMANSFFIRYRIDPPSPYFSVDPVKTFRGQFKQFSNSLADISESLGLVGKKKITYSELEYDFLTKSPKPKTIKLMREYNDQDVVALRNVYKRVLPYIKNHPNVLRLDDRIEGCPQCGGDRIVKRGYQYTKSNMYQRFKCLDCKKWFRRTQAEKYSPKPQFTNIAGN